MPKFLWSKRNSFIPIFVSTQQCNLHASPSSNILHLWLATGMGDGQKFIVQARHGGGRFRSRTSISGHHCRAFLSRGRPKTGWHTTFISHRSQGLAFTSSPPISEDLQKTDFNHCSLEDFDFEIQKYHSLQSGALMIIVLESFHVQRYAMYIIHICKSTKSTVT